MFYTIAGAIIGGLLTYIYCKLTGVSFQRVDYLGSSGEMFVSMGTVVGGAIGFGVGATKLLSGNYF